MQSTIRNIFITTLLFCLSIFMSPEAFPMDVGMSVNGVSFSMSEIAGFRQTIPIQPDVILNAGELGYYRFTDDQNLLPEADLVKIRPELLELIGTLRQERGESFQVIDGLRTPQHNIYLWAAWLSEHPRQLKMLNARGYQSWGEWIAASPTIPGSVSLQSKHQTGDAAEITWSGLENTTERHRDLIAELITELGGKSEGTPLFKTIAVESKWTPAFPFKTKGKPAFRIVYQPSEAPPMPAPHQIGTQVPPPYQDVNALSEKPDEGTPTIHALVFTGNISHQSLVFPTKNDIEEMHDFLREVKKSIKCTLNLNVLSTDAAPIDSKQLLEWIDPLQVHDDDIVLVYYVGNGGADTETRELYLALSSDDHLPRKQLAEALNALPCRLKILLTVCGSSSPPDPESSSPTATETPDDTSGDAIHDRGTTPTPFVWPVTFRQLFLQHEGFLNLTAATEGESVYIDPIREMDFFTIGLLSAIRGYPDRNEDGFVSWEEVFHVTRSRTISIISTFFEDKTQRPKYYGELPKRIKVSQTTPEPKNLSR